MNQIELQGQVLSLLESFKGMEPLNTLFWTKLNYDRENKPSAMWEAIGSGLQNGPTIQRGLTLFKNSDDDLQWRGLTFEECHGAQSAPDFIGSPQQSRIDGNPFEI